jgi:hypothetical protein
MTNQRLSNDPYRPTDPYSQRIAGDDSRADDLRMDDLRNPASLDNDLRSDPELAEGSARGSRVAMLAVAIAVVLGAVFYGLNNSSINQAGTSSTAQTVAPTSTAQNNTTQPPPAPPGMRDVTPRANTDEGVTTGAAPTRPQTPPSSAPTGQDINRSGNPPISNAAPKADKAVPNQ